MWCGRFDRLITPRCGTGMAQLYFFVFYNHCCLVRINKWMDGWMDNDHVDLVHAPIVHSSPFILCGNIMAHFRPTD